MTFKKWRLTVQKIKVRAGGQAKIPVSIVTKYQIEKGEILNVFDMGGGIIFVPEKVKQNKKLRKEFNERLWDQMEQEAENDIRAGRVAGPFETVEELLRDLEK